MIIHKQKKKKKKKKKNLAEKWLWSSVCKNLHYKKCIKRLDGYNIIVSIQSLHALFVMYMFTKMFEYVYKNLRICFFLPKRTKYKVL